jgi:hypothetical protein
MGSAIRVDFAAVQGATASRPRLLERHRSRPEYQALVGL